MGGVLEKAICDTVWAEMGGKPTGGKPACEIEYWDVDRRRLLETSVRRRLASEIQIVVLLSGMTKEDRDKVAKTLSGETVSGGQLNSGDLGKLQTALITALSNIAGLTGLTVKEVMLAIGKPAPDKGAGGWSQGKLLGVIGGSIGGVWLIIWIMVCWCCFREDTGDAEEVGVMVAQD